MSTMAAGQFFFTAFQVLSSISPKQNICFLQGLGILCSPLHGDIGAVTRTVGFKHELINTSVLKLDGILVPFAGQ